MSLDQSTEALKELHIGNTRRRQQARQSATSTPTDSPPTHHNSSVSPAASASSRASHHSLDPRTNQPRRAVPSVGESVQESAEQIEVRPYHIAYEKLFTFAPYANPMKEQDSNTPTRQILERLRYQIFQNVLHVVANEAEKNSDFFERLESVAPRILTHIEELRYQALQQLNLFDSAVNAHPEDAESRAETCAANLQKFAYEIYDSARWIDKRSDSFALGALVMIVEEVVARGVQPGPQQHIYRVLISEPPEDGSELQAFQYITEYPEDIIQEYVDQLAQIIRLLEGMTGHLKPPSLLARGLNAVIQPIRSKREAAAALSSSSPPSPPSSSASSSAPEERPPPEPRRGQKRRESGLYEDAPTGSSAQGGRQSSKRPLRR